MGPKKGKGGKKGDKGKKKGPPPEEQKVPSRTPSAKTLSATSLLAPTTAEEAPPFEEAPPHEPTPPPVVCPELRPIDRLMEGTAFLDSLRGLQEFLLTSDATKTTDEETIARLKTMVDVISTDMGGLKEYCMMAQQQLETIRGPIADMTHKIFKKVPAVVTGPVRAQEAEAPPAVDAKVQEKKPTVEELDLEVRQRTLQVQLTKLADELLRASKITVETETAAIAATKACVEAVEEARRLHEEAENRRLQELEAARVAAEERRVAAAIAAAEEERRLAEEQKALEALKLKLAMTGELTDWPYVEYNCEPNEYDGGVCCVVQANPLYYRGDFMRVSVLDILESGFVYHDNEELVSNIIKLIPTHNEKKMKTPCAVSLPHCLSRANASTREVIVVVESPPGRWLELTTQDVTLDGYKDLKFAKAEVKIYSKMAVISRFKRDTLKLKKRGGQFSPVVDPRIVFTVQPETFVKSEKVVIQLQPVDNVTIGEMKRSVPESKGFLTCSAVVGIDWTSKTFTKPIELSIPIPPNPIVMKKMAAMREAKDAKQAKSGDEPTKKEEKRKEKEKDKDKDEKKKDKKEEKKSDDHEETHAKPLKQIKWYMGQYGKTDDDERDSLYLMRKHMKKAKWTIEHIPLTVPKLDAVDFIMAEPFEKFVIIRTNTSTTEKEVEKMTDAMDKILLQRLCHLLLKQKHEKPSDCILCVVPLPRRERIMRRLTEEKYTDGPHPSPDFLLKEGDQLEIAFRGNIINTNLKAQLTHRFLANMDLTVKLTVKEGDIFVQKSYNVYRGFVELRKVAKVLNTPEKEKNKKGEKETDKHEPAPPRFIMKRIKISEHLISLPKNLELLASKPLIKAPVVYISLNDVITKERLRQISDEMGDEWRNVATTLGVKLMGMQAILRNGMLEKKTENQVKYEVMLMWIKKLPKSADKAEMLSKALASCGRDDLVMKINDMKQQRPTKV